MTRNLLCLLASAALVLLTTSAAFAQDGAALYRRDCSGCHDMGVDRAPARDALQTMTAERVLAAMESGPMISMASRDSGADRRAIAQYVTGKTLSARDLSTTTLTRSASLAACSAYWAEMVRSTGVRPHRPAQTGCFAEVQRSGPTPLRCTAGVAG